MDREQKKKELTKTPIVDGDARPDMPVDPQNKADRKSKKNPDSENKFESERLSDLNSLEDYKDAKSDDQ